MAIPHRIVARTVGAAILVLAAACGGDDAGDSPQFDGVDGTAANQSEPTTDAGQSTDGTTPATTAAGGSKGEVTIDPSTLVLFQVDARVSGIGGGGIYSYYPDPEIRQSAEGRLLEEVLAEGDGYSVVQPREGDPELTLVDDGGCVFAQPITITQGIDTVVLLNKNFVFDAYLRYSQSEYLSLADNGSNAHGGFAKGGVRRDESEQWEIFGDGPLLYSVDLLENEGMFIVGARWAGASVENFTGAEADGIVEVACTYVWTNQ